MDLKPAELTYFNQIVTDREAASWSPNHLTIACNLAKTYAGIDVLWDQLREQGFTIKNDRGTPVANPALTALNSLTQAMQALNRTLGLSASQRGLAGDKQQQRNKTDRDIHDINSETDGHSLLA